MIWFRALLVTLTIAALALVEKAQFAFALLTAALTLYTGTRLQIIRSYHARSFFIRPTKPHSPFWLRVIALGAVVLRALLCLIFVLVVFSSEDRDLVFARGLVFAAVILAGLLLTQLASRALGYRPQYFDYYIGPFLYGALFYLLVSVLFQIDITAEAAQIAGRDDQPSLITRWFLSASEALFGPEIGEVYKALVGALDQIVAQMLFDEDPEAFIHDFSATADAVRRLNDKLQDLIASLLGPIFRPLFAALGIPQTALAYVLRSLSLNILFGYVIATWTSFIRGYRTQRLAEYREELRQQEQL
ncbi:MAG: hypothetical protein MRY63_11750 [Neomegalonema sp.]|nr:hypothetical protein [Neomegalonema sp.]